MAKRNYLQFCGLARALDIVGERWTLLIVRNLLLGPLRYSDLMRGLPGITTNLLATRLREMEAGGLIERIRRAPADGGHAWRLTQLGADLEPAIHALGSWGWGWMGRTERGAHRSFEWLLVALRRRYLGGLTLTAEIVADEVPYRFTLTPEHAEISRGTAPGAALRVRGPGLELATLFLNGVQSGLPASLEASDPAALVSLVESFRRGDTEAPAPPRTAGRAASTANPE